MAGVEQPMEVEQADPPTPVHRGVPDYPPIEVPPAPEKVATLEENGPRLMITHIVNEFFKSYAGTRTLGPFHKSFSSIVGPNGSGKSNVIDSMLFVFGYRANRLRSKKISVLIHNSDDYQNVPSCTVSVHFQRIIDTGEGENDFDVVPNSQFVVSRTAFRDNSSYYKVNDKKATYKEVAALLRGHGIDLDHNRFLILQGEVEQIAMMKPKGQTENDEGMLEFLEDIIGSNRFKEPIEMLTQRVEELNELRSEKLNRVRAVEKEKNELEAVKDEAIEYLTMENEIAQTKNKICQKYILECTESENKATEKRDEERKKMKEHDDKMNEITENKKAKAKQQKAMYKKYETLSARLDTLKEQFSECENKDVRCRDDLKHSKAKAKKLEKTLEQEKKKLEELKAIPEKTQEQIEALEKKLGSLEKEKEKEEGKLKEVMENLKTETQGLQDEKSAKEAELAELQKSVNETKSKYTVAQSELDLYISNQRSEQMKLDKVKASLERTVSALKERKSALADTEKKLPETEAALEKAKADMEKATTREAQKLEEVKQMRVKVEAARSSLSSAKSQGKVLDSLMELKRSGRLPGVYGRLGNLGAIDEKYDVAISTACGALDNILVDTVTTGQKCIEFLKKNNIGRATFIALDKQKEKWGAQCARKINPPEGVPRLFDLVTVQDKEILPAFYFALRDTLVAKDLDQATRIAYGKTRYRVVTLTGQLIDQSGTMSGGGKTVCQGRMGSSLVTDVDPKELSHWEEKLEQDSHDAQTCRQHKVRLEEAVEKMQKTVHELRHGINKLTTDIKGMTEQETLLKQQVQEQQQRVKDAAPDEKALKQLEKTVAGHKKEYEKAAGVASGVEDEVHKLHRQIMDIGGTRLKAAESRINMVQSQIDQITGSITKNKVSIKSAERNTKKCEDKIASVDDEIKENKETMEKLEKNFKELEEEAHKVLLEYQAAQDDMKEVQSALEEVKEEVAELEKQEAALQKGGVDIRHELERFEALVKDNQQKARHWKKELGRLTLNQIDDKEPEQLPTIDPEELVKIKKEDLEYQITVVQERLGQMKPNMAAIAEYRKKEEMYLKRVSELDQITDMRDQQRRLHEDLRKQRLDEFMAGFSTITEKLKEMYQMITLGGDAELELVDSLDPFSEGIVFSVRPPKKSWKNISSLSGGEKTLSSLSLVFALHHYKPTPLYVMDEIDAALDFKNVSIVANYIKQRTKNAQFIIISLRNNMFELADRLIGIFKTHNCTKSVTINPQKMTLHVEAPAPPADTMTTA